jgi:antitoxin ParD1/3/4
VTLPPEQERFADQAIAAGRYRDLSEVVQAGVTLLQEAEAELAAFVASLDAAKAEAEQHGFFSIEEVMAEADATIANMAKAERDQRGGPGASGSCCVPVDTAPDRRR